MGIKQQLMQNFSEILDVKIETEEGHKFLRIKTSLKIIKDIEKLTSKISKFLDEIDYGDEAYYLDIFSSGIELKDEELNSI